MLIQDDVPTKDGKRIPVRRSLRDSICAVTGSHRAKGSTLDAASRVLFG
jgi:hypothetical protein